MRSLHTNAQSSAPSPSEQQMHFTPPQRHRFVFLDALRGIAAMFVVAFHFPLSMASSFAQNGPLAVDFFFCLSGFVIAFSYESRLEKNLSFRDFTAARWIRLYPIYALGSLLGLLIGIVIPYVVFHGENWSHWIPLAVMAVFLWPSRLSSLNYVDNYPLNPAAWSLFFEVFANFAYALLVKLRKGQTPVIALIVAGSLAVMAIASAGGAKLGAGPSQSTFGLGFARVSFSFFLGVLLCRLYRSRAAKSSNEKTSWLLPSIITAALIAILNSPLSCMHSETFRFVAITVLSPAIVYFGSLVRLPLRLAGFSAALGELSYPLYLLHQPLIRLTNARHILRFSVLHPVIIHCVTFFVIIFFALAAWQVGEHIDLPIRRYLTRRYNSFIRATPNPSPARPSSTEIVTPHHDEA